MKKVVVTYQKRKDLYRVVAVQNLLDSVLPGDLLMLSALESFRLLGIETTIV